MSLFLICFFLFNFPYPLIFLRLCLQLRVFKLLRIILAHLTLIPAPFPTFPMMRPVGARHIPMTELALRVNGLLLRAEPAHHAVRLLERAVREGRVVTPVTREQAAAAAESAEGHCS